MKIVIVSDNPEIYPEIHYVCRLLSSLLQAEFTLVNDAQSGARGENVVFYTSEDRVSCEREKTSIQINPNKTLWYKYLHKQEVEKEHIAELITSLLTVNFEHSPKSVINADLFFAIIFLSTRYEEIFATDKKDQHGRFLYKHDTLASLGIDAPLINLWVDAFAKFLSHAYNVKILCRQVKPVAVISHDIDIPFYYKKMINEASCWSKSFFNSEKKYRPGRFKKAVLSSLKFGSDPFDTFSYLNQEESKRNVRSTYFILLSSENSWGLDLDKYRKRLRWLVEHGHEISLHPGYDSFNDIELTKKEKSKVWNLSGVDPVGTRSHFLRFDFPGSYKVREKLGFLYDSSLSYAEREGFKGGLCSPFRPFDPLARCETKILEIPLSVMDVTLSNYRKYSPVQAQEKISRIIDSVSLLNGTVVFNWHNSFFHEKDEAWKAVYENSLDLLQGKGFEFMTCSEVAEKWLNRWPLLESELIK